MFKGYKTYITVALGILTAVAAYLVGDMSVIQLMQTVFTGLIGLFLRNGISTQTQTVIQNVQAAALAVANAPVVQSTSLQSATND